MVVRMTLEQLLGQELSCTTFDGKKVSYPPLFHIGIVNKCEHGVNITISRPGTKSSLDFLVTGNSITPRLTQIEN